MHLLVAAHDLYPDPGSGGTGRYVYETGRRFVERGHRVSVVTRRRGDVPAREELEGIHVRRYDLAVADRGAATVLRQLPGARASVADHLGELSEGAPIDVFSPQDPVTSLLADGAIDGAVPSIPTVHRPWPTEYRIRTGGERSRPRRWANALLRHRLERRILTGADRLVTLSAYMRDAVTETYDLSGSQPAVSVVAGGVDPERFRPAASSGAGLDGTPSFLTVRRLAERMGHDVLLSAFSEVVSTNPAARLHVAGDGPLREAIERRAEELDVADRTTFHGDVPDEGLPGLYAGADVFVLPTPELEGFGLATLEAMASGTPAVATPVGGPVEVLDGLADDPAIAAPVLAAAPEAEALAERLLAWASLPAPALDAAGRACRRHVRDRYPWERTVDGLASVYATVLSAADTPSRNRRVTPPDAREREA